MFFENFWFIDYFFALHDGEEFRKSYKKIYPKELVQKLEHSGFYTTFLGLNITINKGKKSIELYNKYGSFSFFYYLHAKHSQQPSIMFFMELYHRKNQCTNSTYENVRGKTYENMSSSFRIMIYQIEISLEHSNETLF